MAILLVNPFSSAQFLSESFKRMGVKTLAFYTKDLKTLMDYAVPKKEWFDRQIFLETEDVDQILAAIQDEQIDYVLNGSEASVSLTDQLAKKLTPELANDPNTAHLRVSKYHMHEALKKEGLAHIKQVQFVVGEDDCQNEKFCNLKYPCFVKPLNGCFSYGLAKIESFEALCQFFNSVDQQALREALKLYLSRQAKVVYLICEYIEGDEYFVDTFSYQGEHYISSIQRYHNHNHNHNHNHHNDNSSSSNNQHHIMVRRTAIITTNIT